MVFGKGPVRNLARTRPPTFEVFLNRAAKWHWHEKAANGEIVSVSQAYSTKYAAKRAAQRKAAMTPGATWVVRTH